MILQELRQTLRATYPAALARRLAAALLLGLLAQSPAACRESISVEWKRPVNLPVSLTIAPGGRYFGAVDSDGTVRFYNRTGALQWKRRVEGATDLLIAKNGRTLLVYSKLNPVYNTVCFFRGDGRLLWEHCVEESVWSGDISPDGEHAAVTTGDGHIYVYTPDPLRPRFVRWRLDGIGNSTAFVPDGSRVVIGTWQESGIVCYTLKGKLLWRYRHSSERQYCLQASADGRRILGVLPGSQSGLDAELCFWDSGGKLLWRRAVEGFDLRACVSPRSRYVAVSYTNYLSHKASDLVERKVAVYDSSGDLLWDKGGLFFGPSLVALSPTGSSVIVSDGERSLYNIGEHGRILSKLTFGGTIRRTLASDDGRWILVYCGDGWLYLTRVT